MFRVLWVRGPRKLEVANFEAREEKIRSTVWNSKSTLIVQGLDVGGSWFHGQVELALNEDVPVTTSSVGLRSGVVEGARDSGASGAEIPPGPNHPYSLARRIQHVDFPPVVRL